MNGVLPLAYSTIRDWSELRRIRIAPHEVRALIELDDIMCTPVTVEDPT